MKSLKVLMLNGSPHTNGNTAVALREMEAIFKENDVDVETVILGNRDIRGCVACGSCAKTGKCVFDDGVNELAPKFEAADGLVIASPVYYASANATLIACLDRLFYSTPFDKTMKVGASVACARRGGCSATFDELNKYFTISGMPVASSQYWNSIHGRTRRGGAGQRGPPDHADPSTEHDLPDAQHRPGEGGVRPSGKGSADRHPFHQIILEDTALEAGKRTGA